MQFTNLIDVAQSIATITLAIAVMNLIRNS